jgi:cell wall-associated NlpC family hydrolase
MWAAARAAAVWLFGDDVVKYVLYVVGGLFVVVFIEASAATTAIMAQPWGQWWLAGVGGGASVTSASGPTTPGSSTTTVALPTSVAAVPTPAIPRILDVVDIAKTWLGTPYLWGGCSRRGVDCSCFMLNVFREVGITTMPRVTVDQIRWATPITRAEAEAGDLVFFDNTCTGCGANPTHVALYLGNGQMIDAGDPVRIEPVYGGHNARYGRVHP